MAQEVIIDLTNYKDRLGGRVPPGRYLAVTEDVELDKSKKGNQMINVWFRVLEGEYEGTTILDRLVLTDNSMFRVVGYLQAIGLPTPRKRMKLDVAKFVGRKLYIDVDDGEPWNGRVKSEVRGYVKLSAGQEHSNGSGGGTLDTPAASDDAMSVFTESDDTDASADSNDMSDDTQSDAAVIDAPDAPEEIALDSIDLG